MSPPSLTPVDVAFDITIVGGVTRNIKKAATSNIDNHVTKQIRFLPFGPARCFLIRTSSNLFTSIIHMYLSSLFILFYFIFFFVHSFRYE